MNTWRFYDHPRPGSIYRLPDIPSLTRGVTYTFMPNGKKMKVPAQTKRTVSMHSHDQIEGEGFAEALKKLLAGNHDPSDKFQKSMFDQPKKSSLFERRPINPGPRIAG